MINSRILQEILRSLENDVKCPKCNSGYHSDNINFVGQVGPAFLLRLDCPSCNSPLLINVLVQENKMKISTSTKSSDLSSLEIKSNKFNTAIQTNDLIDIATDIRKSTGGFSNIFEK